MTEALAAHDLTRNETRLDEQGFRVIARRRGRQTLVSIRLENGTTRIEPYLPVRAAEATEDQRRWMIYAETYEGRTVIDSWPMGGREAGDLAVITIDQDQEAWRHIIDTDGIELGRRTANDSGAAALFRERGAPQPETPQPETPPAEPRTAQNSALAAPHEENGLDFPAPADSLLTKVRAYLRVTALLRTATDACAVATANGPVPDGALTALRGLRDPLRLLNARFSAGSLGRLITRADTGAMTAHAFTQALEDLVSRLRDELALTRIVLLPAAPRAAEDPPFGGRVEIRFPSAAYDIEEAVHCLALRRTTAAVLHAMKVMRHGLEAVSRLLNTPALTALSWTRLIAAVRDAGGDRDLIDSLSRVRRLWLGPDLMPVGKYTEEEAEAVLEAVAGFMRALAASFDARGEPAAE